MRRVRLLAALIPALLAAGTVRAQDKHCLADAIETLLFLDHTTPFTSLDRRQLFDGVNLIVEQMPTGGRLSLKTIAGSYTAVRTIFQACKPGCPPGAGPLACSEITAKRRDYPAFIRGVETALRGVVEMPAAARSEIAVSLAYGLRTAGETRPRRVYVFSDMIERSSLIDMMGKGSPFRTGQRPDELAALEKRVLEAGFDTRLDGAEIVVFGFGREDGSHQPLDIAVAQRVKLFWTRLFTAMGARSVRFFSDLDR